MVPISINIVSRWKCENFIFGFFLRQFWSEVNFGFGGVLVFQQSIEFLSTFCLESSKNWGFPFDIRNLVSFYPIFSTTDVLTRLICHCSVNVRLIMTWSFRISGFVISWGRICNACLPGEPHNIHHVWTCSPQISILALAWGGWGLKGCPKSFCQLGGLWCGVLEHKVCGRFSPQRLPRLPLITSLLRAVTIFIPHPPPSPINHIPTSPPHVNRFTAFHFSPALHRNLSSGRGALGFLRCSGLKPS